ncbi:hypothetical protein CF327_g3748 [Tilletia walkeri]|nr:hypothetical protein CF327_g3748 [Tilletia walkeri]
MGQLGRQQKDDTVRQEGTTIAMRSKTTVGDITLMRQEGGRLGRADGTGGLKDGPGWYASSPYRAGVITIGSAGTHPGMRPTSLAPTRPISGRHVAFFEADKLEFGGDRIKKESKTAKGKGKGVATGATAEPVADDLGPRSATWKPGLTGKIRNTTAHGRALSRHFKTRTGVGLVDDDGLRGPDEISRRLKTRTRVGLVDDDRLRGPGEKSTSRNMARNLKGAGRRGWQERTVTAGLKARLPQSARRGRTKVGNSSETAQGPVEGGEDKARRTTDLARGVKAFGSTGTVPAIRSAMLLKAVLRRTRGRNTARTTASATTPSRETTNTTILLRAVLQDASHRGRGGGTVTAKVSSTSTYLLSWLLENPTP